MFNYEKFAAAALKNKYEIAFECDRTRVTYGELSKQVSALCNALFNMGVKGPALVLTSDPMRLCVSALALAKCGADRIFGDGKIPQIHLANLLKKKTPELVLLEAAELERLAPVLLEKDIRTVITYGSAEAVFPAQFEYKSLIERNDFVMIKEFEAGGKDLFVYNVDAKFPDLSEIDLRGGIVADVPAFCKGGARIAYGLLLEGRKQSVFTDKSPKSLKKRKVAAVITDSPAQYEGMLFSAFELTLSERRVSDSFADPEKISAYLSSLTPARVNVTFNGAVFAIKVIFPGDKIMPESMQQQKISEIKSAAVDLLYPFDKKKIITILKEKKKY
jgi:hypothetical protein